jgi:vancomycin resistance protein YoaR
MKLLFVLGALLSVQQVNAPESLSLLKNGEIISTINRSDFSQPILPLINLEKMNMLLEQLDKQYGVTPENAKIDISGSIVPEKIGSKVHRQVFTERFFTYYFSNKTLGQIEVPMISVYPRVDSELLGNIHTKRIGRYVTTFNPSNKTRTNNIKLAVHAINNQVVFPGETFSFNKVVGKRTEAKGYLRAKVIIRGEFSEDIGGGICQVSSTLFNAVDNAGLQIVQRFSHSRKVPYIPPGRDATVSWYGPDFVFKNKYNQPVLIQARTFGHMLIIKLYSSDVIEFKPRIVPNPPY